MRHYVCVTEDELRLLRTRRGQQATGYPLHTTRDGRFYFWPWGSQDQSLAQPTIEEAARAFLEVYLPNPGGWNSDHAHPLRRHHERQPA